MQVNIITDSHILMSDCSSKLIEDIKMGDFLYGGGEVISVDRVESEENIFKIYSKNNIETKVINSSNILATCPVGGGLKNFKESNDVSFKSIFDLKIGDLVCSPVYANKKFSILNENRCALLGYFAAEGSYSKKYGKRRAACFTLGINESKIADRIIALFEEEFPECSVIVRYEPERSVINITASGYNISEFFYKHVGEYSHLKKLSSELVFSEDNCKLAFISAWLEGDGCLSTRNKLIGITTSENMAWQIRMMLNSLKIQSSIRLSISKGLRKISKNYREYHCKPSYRLELAGDNYKKLYPSGSSKYQFIDLKTKNINQFYKNYCLHYVKNINISKYHGIIYNIKVSDVSSCVVNGIIVG